MVEIRKISDAVEASGVKCLIHGPAGSGKTFSISTIPDRASILVLSAEAGLLSLKNVAGDIDTIVIKTIDELRDAYEFIASPEGDKYKTIVLDSFTEIAQQVLASELGKTTKDGNAAHGQKAYGEMQQTMMRMAKKFRDMDGKNVILICQQEKQKDADQAIFYGPSMPGQKLGQSILYLFDLVACIRVRAEYMTVEGREEPVLIYRRAWQFSQLADPLYAAKDRTSGALSDFEPPDWGLIFGKINNHKGQE